MGFMDKLQKFIVIVDDDKKEKTEDVKPQRKERAEKIERKQPDKDDKIKEQEKAVIEKKPERKPEKPKRPIKCSKKLSDDLDAEQLKAVEAPLNNTCVIAVAGSGKTRVLTYRVANMIDNGFREEEMTLLTFTRKASQEMTDRIKKILGKKELNLLSGTFHGVANLLLHEYAKEIDMPSDFKVLGPSEGRNIIRELRWKYIKTHMEGAAEENDRKFPDPSIVIDICSGSINHGLTFMDFIRKYYPYFETNGFADPIILLIEDYMRYKKEHKMLDFDDLILKFLEMLSDERVQEKINSKYKYIFVDEHQDINWIQYGILEKLNGNQNMFVIGDPKQCIYQFRGSMPEYITKFKEEHEGARQYTISHNYRSTPEIMAVANDVLNYGEPTSRQIQIQAVIQNGMIPMVRGCMTEIEEMEWIADTIIKENLDVSKTAVLVRKGTQIVLVKQILKSKGIKCKADKEVPFYKKEHVKIAIDFLDTASKTADEDAFVNAARNFSINKNRALSLYQMYKTNGFNAGSRLNEKEADFMSCMDILYENCYNNIKKMLERLKEEFLDRYFQIRFFNYEEVMDDIDFLSKLTDGIKDVSSLRNSLELLQDDSGNSKGNVITITTVHKSKGLEYENGFLPFVTKGLWPRGPESSYIQQTDSIKNERNLFYVGVTRAMKRLYISYSCTVEDNIAGPSPFLTEIKQEHFKKAEEEE